MEITCKTIFFVVNFIAVYAASTEKVAENVDLIKRTTTAQDRTSTLRPGLPMTTKNETRPRRQAPAMMNSTGTPIATTMNPANLTVTTPSPISPPQTTIPALGLTTIPALVLTTPAIATTVITAPIFMTSTLPLTGLSTSTLAPRADLAAALPPLPPIKFPDSG